MSGLTCDFFGKMFFWPDKCLENQEINSQPCPGHHDQLAQRDAHLPVNLWVFQGYNNWVEQK